MDSAWEEDAGFLTAFRYGVDRGAAMHRACPLVVRLSTDACGTGCLKFGRPGLLHGQEIQLLFGM